MSLGTSDDVTENKGDTVNIPYVIENKLLRLSRALHSKCYSGDGDLEQTQELAVLRLSRSAPPPELEETNLQIIQRVDVGVTEAYRFPEHRLTSEQVRCFVDLEDSAPAAVIFLLDAGEDRFAGRGRTH